MKHYVELIVQNISSETADIILALLDNAGFDGFSQDENKLTAYTLADNFDEKIIGDLADQFDFTYSVNQVEDQNWNQLWESNFEPVIVDDFVTVRANFHSSDFDTQHEIIITPKMSFGTGHHATTHMMMQQMRQLNFSHKSVFDFGTGTGVLAILAEKLGAKNILAVDNDDWSIENAQENILANNADKIQIKKVETATTPEIFDIVLANINKNVIIDNAKDLNDILNKNEGYLLLSGLLAEDETDIINIFSKFSLIHKNTLQRAQWISMLWSR